ncbi:MAG: hypothetical protein V1862_09000 [Methanobacteriota archaeon]
MRANPASLSEDGEIIRPCVKARPDGVSLKGGEPDRITRASNGGEFTVCVMTPEGAGERVL